MNWQSLLAEDVTIVLPWTGIRKVYAHDRAWIIRGHEPRVHGWYEFSVTNGRRAWLVGKSEPDISYSQNDWSRINGYLVGDRIVPHETGVRDIAFLTSATRKVFCLERGIQIISPIETVLDPEGKCIFIQQDHRGPADSDVYDAYCDRAENIDDIADVTPALHAAFLWATHCRDEAEGLAQARRDAIEAEQKQKEMMESIGTAVGRRALSVDDFTAAAKSALEVGGASLLDVRRGRNDNEMVVRYSVDAKRLECTCDSRTLRIIDSGVCLTDHKGFKGDTLFTLETLPSVISEAVERDLLVVWRNG